MSKLLVSFFLLCCTNSLFAQQIDGDSFIKIDSARLTENESGWLLSANADIQLSPKIRQGLNSGVPLQFIVDFRIKRDIKLWPDKTLFSLQQRYSLIYYVLTRHYRLQLIETTSGAAASDKVNNANSLNTVTGNNKADNSQNFRSLLTALDSLGNLQALPVKKPDIDLNGPLYGQLSYRLDEKALPLPLQSLLPSDWKLVSEDYAWSLN